MLRLEKPFVGVVDEDGNVSSARSEGFNMTDIENELIVCAKKIVNDYEMEFLLTDDDNVCRFCGYKFYCAKWDA